MNKGRRVAGMLLLVCSLQAAIAQTKLRARDLGVPFEGTPGPLNAITDVKGVEVGHTTLISGSGPLRVGVGPVRTGVTAVLPRGRDNSDPVFAGCAHRHRVPHNPPVHRLDLRDAVNGRANRSSHVDLHGRVRPPRRDSCVAALGDRTIRRRVL